LNPADNPTQTPSPRWRHWLPPLLIVVAAIGYYGSYIQFWFNPTDEGGSNALIAMRIAAGETPMKDVELGYNVGWFLPIVALFKIFGTDFLLMRGWFFFLSTLTALCGWAVVRKLTCNDWIALGAGLLLVIFPGSQFKNYIPLCCVANALCVVHAVMGSEKDAAFLWRLALAGLVLGLTFLIRIDLGYLFTLLWLGVAFLFLFDCRRKLARRFVMALAIPSLLLSVVFALHLPVWFWSGQRGFSTEFARQYQGWADLIAGKAESVVSRRAEMAPVPPPGTASGKPTVDRSTLPRVSWEVARSLVAPDKTILFILTYALPLFYLVLLVWAVMICVRQVLAGSFTPTSPPALALIVLISSLATFPQFFFFRPDRPHLAEFMPGCFVATLSATVLLAHGAVRWAFGGILALLFALFGWFAFDHYSAGTIAARAKIKKNKRMLFEGENGVRVLVHEREFEKLEKVRKAIASHSNPGEWLICYPYQPGYNVMTNRPTYERELYQDNATAPRGWGRQAIARIEEMRPAVVVIDDRAINQVDASKFSVWARRVHDYLRENYQLVETIGTIEIYARTAGPLDP
jgi:hypothetical protein